MNNDAYTKIKRYSGFTLIEMLVMIAIAGIIVGLVSLSVGSGSRVEQMKAESERLYGMMQLSLEEAVLTSKPIGLKFTEDFEQGSPRFEYEWSTLQDGRWLVTQDDTFFTRMQFMQGLDIDLQIEGLPISLQEKIKNRKRQTSKDDSGSKNQGDEDEEDKLKRYQPDIFFLHSGELSPAFTLVMTVEGLEEQYRIIGNELGKLQFLRRNDLDESL